MGVALMSLIPFQRIRAFSALSDVLLLERAVAAALRTAGDALSSVARDTVAVTAPGSVACSLGDTRALVSGAGSVSLVRSPGTRIGDTVTVKSLGSALTLSAADGALIDSAATLAVGANAGVTVLWDGQRWRIMGAT